MNKRESEKEIKEIFAEFRESLEELKKLVLDKKGGINESTVRRNAIYSNNIDRIKEIDNSANNILGGKI